MKTTLVALALIFLSNSFCLALDPEHKKAIMKFFELSQQKQQYETSMKASLGSSMSASLAQLPPDQKAKVQRAMTKVEAFMMKEMGWEAVKDEIAEIYGAQISLTEITAVLPLFAKPEMQTLISKQISVIPAAANVGAKRAQALQPQIMQIMQKELAPPLPPKPVKPQTKRPTK